MGILGRVEGNGSFDGDLLTGGVGGDGVVRRQHLKLCK